MSEDRIPAFKSAAEQDEWFVQDGLRSRIEGGTPDNETRGYLSMSVYAKDWVNRALDGDSLIPSDSAKRIIMIDNDNPQAALDEVEEILLASPLKDGEYSASLKLSGARGTNFSSHTSGAKNSGRIISFFSDAITSALKEGYLTPVDVPYKPELLAQYKTGTQPG